MLIEVNTQEKIDELTQLKDEAFRNPHYKNAFSNEYTPGKGVQDVYKDLVFLSVNQDSDIVGCIIATHHFNENRVSGVTMLNFLGKPSAIYAKDMYEFISTYLFEKLKVHKANWSSIVGSKYEKFSDKIARDLGGRVVGIYKDDTKNAIGELCDVKEYELLRSDYLKKKYGDDF